MTRSMNDPHMRWFHEARFGMFIHWGLYSLLGRGTWVMHNDRLPVSYMRTIADEFNPSHFDAEAWADLASRAGMKYAVLTTRHHDGFCLFDSAVSEFTTTKTAAGRDFVAEYVDAFRAAGLRVGLYYSLLDWRFPGYFEPDRYPASREALVAQAHSQVRELLTNYGKIDLLWFDGHWLADIRGSLFDRPETIPPFWRSEELISMIRELQPDIVVNDRAGAPGDFDTPEQTLARASGEDRAWELCQTIGDWDQAWAHQRFNPTPIRKHSGQLILQLVVAARSEGNVLLNVGPDADGLIPTQEERVLEEIGAWLRDHGEAIYGSERSPIRGNAVGGWTFRGTTGYLGFACWPGRDITVHGVDGTIEGVRMLATGDALDYEFDPGSGRLTITGLPESPPHPDVNVIEVRFADRPRPMALDDTSSWLE